MYQNRSEYIRMYEADEDDCEEFHEDKTGQHICCQTMMLIADMIMIWYEWEFDTRYEWEFDMRYEWYGAHLPGTDVRGMKRANQPRRTKIEEGRVYGLEMVQKIQTDWFERARGQSKMSI